MFCLQTDGAVKRHVQLLSLWRTIRSYIRIVAISYRIISVSAVSWKQQWGHFFCTGIFIGNDINLLFNVHSIGFIAIMELIEFGDKIENYC